MYLWRRCLAIAAVTCVALHARAQDCVPTASKLSISPQMLQFDNHGQGFVSSLYHDDLSALLELSRQWTACITQDVNAPVRLLSLGTQAFLAFRLQFANAYVLHEYAHAESAWRLQLAHIRVGTNDGSPITAAPYLANLARMAFDPRQIGDMGRRGVSVAWDNLPLAPASLTQLHAAGLNLNSYLAWQSFVSMVHGDASPSRAMGYAINKWFSPVYFEMDQRIGGDPSTYIEDLAAQGIQTNKSAIQQVQLAAALLSNGMWTSARNLLRYGDATSAVAPLHWTATVPATAQDLTIYWPEFSSYLNQRGVSLGSEVALAVASHQGWTLGLERNVIGQDQGTDVSVGLRQTWGAMTLSGRITHNQGNAFASMDAQYRLNSQVGVTALVYRAQGDTLVGQRLAFRSNNGGYLGLIIYL